MAPIRIVAELDKNGRKFVLGRVFPDHYVNIQEFSTGYPKNLSVRVDNDGSRALVYEFPDGAYTSIRHPHRKYLPLTSYTKRSLDAVLGPGQSFTHDLETKSHLKGKVTFTYVPPKKHKAMQYFAH